ncbi:MAG: glycosyl transferase [Patescibacteria group bacterium]|nr:MAG: glycosyl transferase [Patescibacteria group bacterium]
MANIFLSVIIPCYNERENIKRGVLEEVYDFLKRKKFGWEVIISDDGSSDESRDLVRKKLKDLKGFILLENPHGGKPSALLSGIKKAKGRYILFSDMDQSTPIGELEKLLPYTKDNTEAIIGSRGVVRKDFPIYRKIGAVVFMMIRRLMILPEIVDTQCGFKLFRADILKDIFPKLEFFKDKREKVGWIVTSYDVELLHLIKKHGGKIVEVPVFWQDRDESKTKGSSLSKYIKESKNMFLQIIRVRINELRGLYN